MVPGTTGYRTIMHLQIMEINRDQTHIFPAGYLITRNFRNHEIQTKTSR